MSTSLSLRHSETSSWDRPFQTRSHKWYFLHQRERGLTAPLRRSARRRGHGAGSPGSADKSRVDFRGAFLASARREGCEYKKGGREGRLRSEERARALQVLDPKDQGRRCLFNSTFVSETPPRTGTRSSEVSPKPRRAFVKQKPRPQAFWVVMFLAFPQFSFPVGSFYLQPTSWRFL